MTVDDIDRIQGWIIEAKKQLDAAVADVFAPGTQVSWLHQDRHRQFGIVQSLVIGDQHCDPRLIVLNVYTQRAVAVGLHMSPKPDAFRQWLEEKQR